MLVIRLELEKSKENYQAVVKALEGFDIASASWEDEVKQAAKSTQSGKTDPGDLAANLSAAVDSLRNNSAVRDS